MNAIIFFTTFSIGFINYAHGSTCEIVGLKTDGYYGEYKFSMPINDTFRGEIISFETRNILRMKIQKLDYLNATWENQILKFSTSDRFENYEKESGYTRKPSINVIIDAVCTEDTKKEMTFTQPIIDNNNHAPLLNKDRYDYSFGMAIPKDFKLTDLLPIRATEYDITTDGVVFGIEENEFFSLTRKGQYISRTKEFSATLTTLKNITAPFSHTFNLTVTDDGHPNRTTSALLTITVGTPDELQNGKEEEEEINTSEEENKEEEEEKTVHPPVFAKHLYFSDYDFNQQFKMEEPITIIVGAQNDTKLKQKGFEKYFKVRFEDSSHEKIIVDKVISLPNEIIETTDIITMEIEAVNEGLHMPGRTALLIRLPKLDRNNNAISSENSNENTVGISNKNECDLDINVGYSRNGYLVPLMLFLLAVFCIIFTNVFVAIMFVSKNKTGLHGV